MNQNKIHNLAWVDLRDADLRNADLRDAYLAGVDLRDADLTGANLLGADLRDADLRNADLRDADLRNADLRDADLRYADLRGANFRYADLSLADMRGAILLDANLTGAKLSGIRLNRFSTELHTAYLTEIRDDVWAVLSASPCEVSALREALVSGHVDGSCYAGLCACLVGTLAKARGCNPYRIPGLSPDSTRPAERFFLGINAGDKPGSNQVSAIALEWVDTWLNNVRAAFEPLLPEEVRKFLEEFTQPPFASFLPATACRAENLLNKFKEVGHGNTTTATPVAAD